MPREKGRPGHAVVRIDSDVGKRNKKISSLVPVIEHLRITLDSQPDYLGFSNYLDDAVDDVVLDILESEPDAPIMLAHLYRSVLTSPVVLDEMSMHRYSTPTKEVIRVCEVSLGRGFVALVDTEDYDRVSEYVWGASFTNSVYALRKWREDKKTVRQSMHDFLMNTPTGSRVEHINGNALDNRRANLRIVTDAPKVP
jgi:hypothetical protein